MSQLQHFHEGEAAMQEAAGVDTETFDRMVGPAFQPALSPGEVDFVNRRTFSVAASVDGSGRPWASPLFGPAGELFSVEDPETVLIHPEAVAGDPLWANVEATGRFGVLYFDPSRRRRAKSTGRAELTPDGSIRYRMQRNFGLCTKYIFKRNHEMTGHPTPEPTAHREPRSTAALDADDRHQLSASDTAFLASFHPGHGADPTHRGGPAGFIEVMDDRTLAMPDYMGNGMFQTLGNLLLDDRLGVTTVDFATGRTLHVTGHGSIRPAPPDDELAERTLVIAIDEVRVSWPNAGRWVDVEPFVPAPGMVNPATPYRNTPYRDRP